MNLITAGKAPRITQPEEGASYEPYITAKPELAEIKWAEHGQNQRRLHNFIRGNDSVPGAIDAFTNNAIIFVAGLDTFEWPEDDFIGQFTLETIGSSWHGPLR